MKKDTVAAIVPAYNEADKIGRVLKVLVKTKLLDEIIVIDDGSEDGTCDVAKKFKGVKVLKNEENIGKAQSMERGVKESTASVIFFCDADLINLKSGIVEGVVEPILRDEYPMFLGLRDNAMQSALWDVAILTGERAMRREFWEKLPKVFKNRYRVEAGLNGLAQKHGGYGWKRFDYQQPIKEEKYGFWRGHFLRWWMQCDVVTAWALVILYRMHFFR